MGKIFGTDGARGIAISELTTELAMNIGRAFAVILKREVEKPVIYIGKDTRISSDILEAAIVAGATSAGAEVVILGVIPTPAVAYLINLSKENNPLAKADGGIMISASHNSFEYNGIKLFSSTGFKLPDELENEIEDIILDTPEKMPLATHENVGKICHCQNLKEKYTDFLFSKVKVANLKNDVYFDLSNGSAAATLDDIFKKDTDFSFKSLANTPNGVNINDNCGSTHIENAAQKQEKNSDFVYIAFDGDADRCLMIDEKGELVDGDQIVAICADYYGYTDVVVTVMTNIGFHKFAKEKGINVHITKVGDRYVLEEMLKHNYHLGGEQSGHIIFYPESTTGDGQLTAIKVLNVMFETGKTLHELANVMKKYPQVLKNIKVTPDVKAIWKDKVNIQKYTDILGENGRVLVRESGTEPLIRVMLEGENLAEITQYADEIIAEIEKL